MKKIVLIAVFGLASFLSSAQMRYRDSNRIGISVGVNQFDINTRNFDTNPELGWNLGLSIRGNFYNDFDMVYAMQFSENKFSVPTLNAALQKEDVSFKLPSAQISLMLSYKIVENHLSIEAGPMIQINDKFSIDEDTNKTNTIANTSLEAQDIMKISRFNFYPAVGITAGVKHVRLNVQYQYGVTNILGNLNGEGLGQNFKGHAGILCGNIIFYL
jgi:hypothetical protein